jgi:flagellar assembly factor FliW
MPLTLNSSRFGTVEVPGQALIEFPFGLIGLPGRRYALLGRDDDSPFMWLQSTDDPYLAIPVVDPLRFFESYAIELSSDDAARIGSSDSAKTVAFVTVRIDDDPECFSANLRAPIVLSEGRGYQVINQIPDAPLRAPLLAPTVDTATA